jgi:hypothetical protein
MEGEQLRVATGSPVVEDPIAGLKRELTKLMTHESIDKEVAVHTMNLFHSMETIFHKECTRRDKAIQDCHHTMEVQMLKMGGQSVPQHPVQLPTPKSKGRW